jgi:glycerate kinase
VRRKNVQAKAEALRVLVCPDKFKGTLTATEAADAMAAGWRRVRPDDTIERLPISDGGDGFGELLGAQHDAEEMVCPTVDAAHRPVRARWWWEPKRRLAIIEAARVIGLAMLPAGRFHPFELDTFGLGAVIRAAVAKRPADLLIGIGGSATNDAGFGLARAWGWDFLDAAGKSITNWTDLVGLQRVLEGSLPARFPTLHVAVDVQNALLGARGATRIYGPQKGIRSEDVRPAEYALARLVEVLAGPRRSVRTLANAPGAGAAGGLGFGLSVFFDGELEPGFARFARETDFGKRVEWADVVVTGEGALDDTTVRMGKGVGQVARLCGRLKTPCLGLAGSVNLGKAGPGPFAVVAGIVPELATLDEARAKPSHWLRELARRTAASWEED